MHKEFSKAKQDGRLIRLCESDMKSEKERTTKFTTKERKPPRNLTDNEMVSWALFTLIYNVFFVLGFSIRTIGWLRLRLCVYVCFWNWKEVSSNEPNVTLNMAIFKLTSMQTHYTSEKPLTLRHYGQISFIWQRVCALFLCLFYTVSSREVT